MNHKANFYLLCCFVFALSILGTSHRTHAQQQSGRSSNRTTNAKQSGYTMRYKLQPGESIVSKVTHEAETRTKIQGHEESSSSRTVSEKVWIVKDRNANGDMTFEYRINSVQLTQTIGEGETLTYDSQKDEEVPTAFEHVAETVNKPLAEITINSRGQVVNRDKELKTPQLGLGELTIPLPEEPIVIGGQWSVPRELRVKTEDGAYKAIKVRELYTLERVSTGIATISIKAEPLTPVTDASIEAQLIQQLSKGVFKFDLDRGRVVSKSLDWSDEVVGFQGPESSLRYDAKFSEEVQTRTAANQSNRVR
ncbi:MAG: hypothetical protein KDB03_15005 [Planctomycetales bacterium]|nr:hypothetical protein [Planctomycetales bacterium]